MLINDFRFALQQKHNTDVCIYYSDGPALYFNCDLGQRRRTYHLSLSSEHDQRPNCHCRQNLNGIFIIIVTCESVSCNFFIIYLFLPVKISKNS